jgi:OmpA-OmpF porin, OOP family
MRRLVLVGWCALLAACADPDSVVLVRSLLTDRPPEVTVERGSEQRTLTQPLDTVDVRADQLTPRRSTLEEVRARYGGMLDSVPEPSRMYTLLFATGQQALPPDAEPTIVALLADVASHPVVEVQITGHTDRMGSVEANDRLSLERAIAVRDALLARGLTASLVRVVGRGEREPLVRTGDEVPEIYNRRVDILVR